MASAGLHVWSRIGRLRLKGQQSVPFDHSDRKQIEQSEKFQTPRDQHCASQNYLTTHNAGMDLDAKAIPNLFPCKPTENTRLADKRANDCNKASFAKPK